MSDGCVILTLLGNYLDCGSNTSLAWTSRYLNILTREIILNVPRSFIRPFVPLRGLVGGTSYHCVFFGASTLGAFPTQEASTSLRDSRSYPIEKQFLHQVEIPPRTLA